MATPPIRGIGRVWIWRSEFGAEYHPRAIAKLRTQRVNIADARSAATNTMSCMLFLSFYGSSESRPEVSRAYGHRAKKNRSRDRFQKETWGANEATSAESKYLERSKEHCGPGVVAQLAEPKPRQPERQRLAARGLQTTGDVGTL